MPRGNEIRNQRAAKQVERIRKLYSQIGEPLPADIIIDLHIHLALPLAAVRSDEEARPRPRRGAEA